MAAIPSEQAAAIRRAEENRRRTADLQPDQIRYWRTIIFAAGITLNIIWWEIVLKRIIGEKRVAAGRSKRIRRYARRFRQLAVKMGGVMIKLGQFISARVDVMPPELIEELAGLQDEVPAVNVSAVRRVIEEELGRPVSSIYAEFEDEAKAAASLGQVHGARLTTGEKVVVKVLRPGIERIVATDLAALRVVARWTMRWRLIARRADVPALTEEFARTLWEEVDYISEMDNAERFHDMFADDIQVYTPSIHRDLSTSRVITMEDVTSLKITSLEEIERAGVNPRAVARKLFDMYMQMIFVHGFFHADPHPGNIFLYPLPDDAVHAMYGRNSFSTRPFYIVFVDFGMVGRITQRVQEGLREVIIAVGTRDSQRLVESYRTLGMLLPTADTARVIEAQAEALDFIWGQSTTEVANMPVYEMEQFANKYRDLLYDMPFQVPQDFVYLARALGILSGITVQLDEDFNPWDDVATYAQQMISREARNTNVVREVRNLGISALGLPKQLENVAMKLERGDIDVRFKPGAAIQRDMQELHYVGTGITRTLFFATFFLAATVLLAAGAIAGAPSLTIAAIVLYVISGLALLTLILRPRERLR